MQEKKRGKDMVSEVSPKPNPMGELRSINCTTEARRPGCNALHQAFTMGQPPGEGEDKPLISNKQQLEKGYTSLVKRIWMDTSSICHVAYLFFKSNFFKEAKDATPLWNMHCKCSFLVVCTFLTLHFYRQIDQASMFSGFDDHV